MNHEQWSGQEIAIVGMSFSLPGARSREEFWRNLRNGVESVTSLSNFDLEAAGMSPEQINEPQFVSASGRIGDVSLFDAHFFGYSPNEAAQIDPQQRLFLECAWEAVEDAGYDLTRWKGVVGVFAGSKVSTYAENLRGREKEASDFSFLGNDKDFLATTVSYKLNLTGPSVNVQTACSTSLVSVFFASQALLSYQCDMALSGAVSITVPQERGYVYIENGVMSPDGHCRAFDESARGAAPGNGVAVLVLKRLSDALRDCDHIHAIVRGSAINNDGAGKVGYTAPGVGGQAEVIAMAMAAAQVGPESISYIETHGTGTPLGDTVEVAALTKAFRSGTTRKQYCPIGSVKTNIGHTDTVSGAAGLIKTVLALQHGMLPPSLNFATPNPQINFADSPFYVNSKLQEWRRGVTPRRAGVSSFGLGGSNAHTIVEEAPVVYPGPASLNRHLVVLSAKTPESLDRASEALATRLASEPASNMADVAYTLGVGRKAFEYRKAVLCSDAQEASSALLSKKAWSGRAEERRNVVFMFPGVGDHYPNMTAELYRCFSQFRAEIDRCCAFLKPLLGKDLLDILYPGEGKESHQNNGGAERTVRRLLDRVRTAPVSTNEIHTTQISHCIVFMVEYALARLWMSLGLKPAALIGYSLGEYVAACIAGVFSLEDALTVVVARARLLEQQPAGMMLAVAMSAEEARHFVTSNLAIAAVNGPELCVFAGTPEEVKELERRLLGDFIACRILPVERPLHSPLLKTAAEEYAKFLISIPRRRPSIPYLSNVSGDWIKDEQSGDPLYWAAHTVQTVLFSNGIRELLKAPGTTLLEVGPGQSLGSFVLQHAHLPDGLIVLPSVPYEQGALSDIDFFLESAARLWLSGTELDWTKLYLNEKRSRVPLPSYQFDRQRYWIDAAPPESLPSARLLKKSSVADWLYMPGWKRSPLPVQEGISNNERKHWLVFANHTALCSAMVSSLCHAGQNVRIVIEGDRFEALPDGKFVLTPGDLPAYRNLIESLRRETFLVDRVLHFWNFNEKERARDQESSAGFFSLVYLMQALGSSQPVDIDVVASGTQEVVGDEMIVPERAMVLPLCRTASQEYNNIRCRHIDVGIQENELSIVPLLLQEIGLFDAGQRVAYRGCHRWLENFTPIKVSLAPPIRVKGTYVITGGLGQVGLVMAEYFGHNYHANVVLVGRSRLPERSEWQRYLQVHDSSDPTARKIATLQSLEARGGQFCVVNADVADLSMMTRVFEGARAKYGEIHGVIHAAGVTDPKSMRGIDEITSEQAQTHFRAKIEGARVLSKVMRGHSLDFCVLMSSLSAVLGGLGMGAYGAANQYLDALALRESRSSQTAWLSIAWDTWDVGRDKDAHLSQSALSDLVMTPAEGMEAFMFLLSAASLRQLVVSIGDLDSRLQQWAIRDTSIREQQTHRSVRHSRPKLATVFVEPNTEIEKNIAAIWAESLGLDQVGLDDNFFQLGGHSLLGIRVTGRMQREFDIPIHVREIFKFPTVAEFSKAILEKMAELLEHQGWPDNVQEAKSSEQPETHFVHG